MAARRIAHTADKSQRISKAVLDEQRASLSTRQFAQDYLCEFSDFEDQVFRTAAIERAFKKGIEPLHIGTQWRRDPNHARTVK